MDKLFFRAELENNKRDCAAKGLYDDAEILKNKIEELKKQLKIKKRKDLEFQHMSEVENLEQTYRQEVEEYNAEWDAKFRELEERSRIFEEQLNEKHAKEMEELYAFLEQKLPKNVKFSREFLELKNQEMNLVKLQKFKEAAVIQKKIEALEKKDSEKWNKEKNDKIKSQTVKTAQKHLIEKNAMKKKIEIELEVMKKEKDYGLEIIVHKYKNRKFDLEKQQKQEKLLNENANLLKASKFISLP